MPRLFRNTVILSTAVIALGAFAAAAAPPVAADAPAVHSSGATGSKAPNAVQPTAHRPMASHIDQRINVLHTKLQISSAQQPQWDQFTQTMRENAQAMDDRFQRRVQTMPTMSAAENMQSYAHLVAEHGQDVQKLAAAFDMLYASMSDQQKRIADQSFRDDAHRGDPTRAR
jgi:protein CpxP